MVLNLIFLGPPGAGKGTVAQAVAEKYKLTQVSTGDLIRAEVSSGSEMGKKLKKIIDAGQLVTDEIVAEMLENKLKALSKNKDYGGAIFDGFPRTLGQAPMLDKILSDVKQKLDAVIYIESSEESVVSRLSSRWTCTKCKKVYNTQTMPSKKVGVCDDDNAPLAQRDDDKPETIKKRYKVFIDQTSPLINHYDKQKILHRYDGNVPPAPSIKAAEAIIAKIVKSKKN